MHLPFVPRGRAAYDSDRRTIPPGFTRSWTQRCDCGEGREEGRRLGDDGFGGSVSEDKALEEREREREREKGDRWEVCMRMQRENDDVLLTQTVCSFLFHKSLIYNYDMHSFV